MRKHITILIEAFIVGIIMLISNKFMKFIEENKRIFLIGFLFHIVFEYMGWNESWCRNVFF